ncbi:hypothetical protein Adt_46119 [Abeliophyllum distichum]|uniref:Uncharacterized protein n=1 Tax=Abeliophyllum distichum TaxID=126358 RepID=A0ABD1P2X7_9LAMI
MPNIMPHLILDGPLQTSSFIWDLVFCRRTIPTQGPSLFIKAWHQLEKTQYHTSSDIGRASTNKPLPLGNRLFRSKLLQLWIFAFATKPLPLGTRLFCSKLLQL